jgi:hypothetical protein
MTVGALMGHDDLVIIGRVAGALALGAMIGFERTFHRQARRFSHAFSGVHRVGSVTGDLNGQDGGSSSTAAITTELDPIAPLHSVRNLVENRIQNIF